ncbi:MAG: hypothetical protein IJQ53_01645 [Clostridia bacterium]|nr:hypothetical protein [Clostridia bacterium]
MKKKLTVCAFCILIIFTVVFTVIQAVKTYNYEAAHYDILVGLGAGMTIIVGGFVVLYELDLFYTVYYFLFKPKTKTKTALNFFANLILITVFVLFLLSNMYMELRKFEFVPMLLIVAYMVIRIACFIISGLQFQQKADSSASK